MKTFIFQLAALLLFSFSAYAQTNATIGGSGVCIVDQDPDLITSMQTQDLRFGCLIAYDPVGQNLYRYNSTAASGSRWTLVPLAAVSDTDLRLDNPRVTGGNLVFDIIDVVNTGVVGTETVAISSIAPIQSVVGGGDVTVNTVAGVATVTYNEAVSSVVAGAGISVGNVGGVHTVTNTAPNVDQTLSTSTIGDNVRITLTNGGNVDLIPGAGIAVSQATEDVTITSTQAATVSATNHTTAGVAGVAIGGYYYASADNTMGAVPGTKLRRMF